MTTVLKKIEDFVNNIAPDYTTTHIVPRGCPRFVDQLMKGTTRFSRRIGDVLPNLQPQNRTTLTADVTPQQTVLSVASIYPGFYPGSLIRVNKQEVLLIEDIDAQLLKIYLNQELFVAYSAGDTVDLHSVPVYYYAPITGRTFYIRSSYRILPGDDLYILQDPVIPLSGRDYAVVDAVQIGMTGNDFITAVTIDQDLPRVFSLNDTLYLRAYTGYLSPIVNIPFHRKRPVYLGPFVVDYISGKFDDGGEIPETLALQVYQQSSTVENPLLGTAPSYSSSGYFSKVSKNYPVLAVPIHASSFLFWDIITGSVNYQTDTFIMTADANGRATISTELTPAWVGPQAWECLAKSIDSPYGSLYYKFYPDTFLRTAGVVDNSSFTRQQFILNNSLASTRVEVTYVGLPYTSVKWTLWSPIGQVANKLQYSIVGGAVGNNNWQAGSLMIKPYFNVIADIEGSFDSDSFNNGAVRF